MTLRRTPIRARRATPRRSPGRDDHGHTVETGRAETFARARGRCELQGPGCTVTATDWHHRQTRRYGPDCPCNTVALCSHCHHVNVHGRPEWARETGWIVSRHSANPGAVPLVLGGSGPARGPVLLPCVGGYATVDGTPLWLGG